MSSTAIPVANSTRTDAIHVPIATAIMHEIPMYHDIAHMSARTQRGQLATARLTLVSAALA